jgi:hypothetical protein
MWDRCNNYPTAFNLQTEIPQTGDIVELKYIFFLIIPHLTRTDKLFSNVFVIQSGLNLNLVLTPKMFQAKILGNCNCASSGILTHKSGRNI